MLVDKILKFLDSERLAADDPRLANLFMEGRERTTALFERLLARRDDKSTNVLRPSKLGHPCTRKLAYQKLGYTETDPMPTRTSLVFTIGDIAEVVLAVLGRAAISIYEPTWYFLPSISRMSLEFDGGKITGVCDDILITDKGPVLVEYKSMSSYSYDQMEKTQEIDNTFGYRTQHDLYREGYKKTLDVKQLPGLLVAYRKDSGNIQEVRTEDSLVHNLDRALKAAEELSRLITHPAIAGGRFDEEIFPRFALEDDKKKGYKRLAVQCRYCSWMHQCWEVDAGIGLEKVLRNKRNIWLVKDAK